MSGLEPMLRRARPGHRRARMPMAASVGRAGAGRRVARGGDAESTFG